MCNTWAQGAPYTMAFHVELYKSWVGPHVFFLFHHLVPSASVTVTPDLLQDTSTLLGAMWYRAFGQEDQ